LSDDGAQKDDSPLARFPGLVIVARLRESLERGQDLIAAGAQELIARERANIVEGQERQVFSGPPQANQQRPPVYGQAFLPDALQVVTHGGLHPASILSRLNNGLATG
jgi:hypothetical protein